MTREELKEIVERALNKLAEEDTPDTACLWWDVACADDPCACADDPCNCADDPCACNDIIQEQ